MFSCLQILEAFLWFVLITLLNVTLIILTLSVSRLLNLLLRLVAFLDRKSGSAGMPRPISYAVFCLKKKKTEVRAGAVFQPLFHTVTPRVPFVLACGTVGCRPHRAGC